MQLCGGPDWENAVEYLKNAIDLQKLIGVKMGSEENSIKNYENIYNYGVKMSRNI